MADDDPGGNCSGSWGGSPDGLARDSSASDELDRFLQVLADQRRRYLLYYLVDRQDEAIEREELTEAVCGYERVGTDSSDEPDPESVSTDLHHRVLPRLDDEGVLDYDARQGTVRVRYHPSLVALLEVAFDHEMSRAE